MDVDDHGVGHDPHVRPVIPPGPEVELGTGQQRSDSRQRAVEPDVADEPTRLELVGVAGPEHSQGEPNPGRVGRREVGGQAFDEFVSVGSVGRRSPDR